MSRYPYSGHSVLMGKVTKGWQDTDDILGMFGEKVGRARRAYKEFVENGISQGRRKDLTGGGLIRSAGGWEAVKALKMEKVYQRSDERILGDGDFVDRVFIAAEEAMEKSYALKARGFDLARTAFRVSEVLEIRPEGVWAKGRSRQTVAARSLFCYWAVRELGIPMSLLGRKLGISIQSVSKSVIRGQVIADSKGFSLL